MALIKLKNVTVGRINRNGYGVQVVESNDVKGKTYTQRYTVWFTEPHGLAEGDVVSVSGFLGAKIGEPWTDKEGNTRQSVELSVNSPRMDDSAPVAPAAGFTAPAGWTETSDESPF